MNIFSVSEYLESSLKTYRTLLYQTSPEHPHAVFALGSLSVSIFYFINNLQLQEARGMIWWTSSTVFSNA